MPGQPMVIGPFIRGLNNVSSAGESEDTEVVELINMDVSLDRSLESRPPITLVPNTVVTADNFQYKVYGTYIVSETEWYLIILYPNTQGGGSIRALRNGDPTDNVVIYNLDATASNNIPSDMVQFKDACYFITPPGATIPGFSWSNTNPRTEIPQMPKAHVLISWKNRLWAAGSPQSPVNGDRVWFSSVDAAGLHPDKWEATNFFDTAPGEGGYITAMIPFFNNLLIFKNDGTWRFSYSSSPDGGLVEKISGTVGAANQNCVVEFENVVYCYDQGTVYGLMNSSFNPINIKTKFKSDGNSDFTEPNDAALSVLNRKLCVRYRNSIYMYSAETKAWSQWRSSRGLPYRFYELPGDSASAKSSTFVAANHASNYRAQLIELETINPRFDESDAQGVVLYENGIISVSGLSSAQMINITPQEYISVGARQQLTVSATVDSISGMEFISARFRFYNVQGTASVQTVALTGTNVSASVTSPVDAVYCEVFILASPLAGETDNTLSISRLVLNKDAGQSPCSLLALTNETNESNIPQEMISCSITTKVYDFGQPSVFKRLFLWGVDVKTLNRVVTSTKISSRNRSITFGDLTAHTHDELSTGTWSTPLRMMNGSVQVVDRTDPIVEQTDTNRFFIKLLKGLRFRQISFNIKMSSDGTVYTGPAKIYTLTAYVSAKQMVVDKIS